ncbi:helix-turn-helix domain-containing protein [Streptomyces sp. NBC_00343]|uniref:helix-turn-helix domain-containing protein n=1 Tax=Streptomyces sp. NBC_00343 TaxID=2975719 RepID=UPI002E29BAC2|nr:helix-turn-helix transcriptional regulator [Streptomyces sp. NBC_00343]
MGRPEIPVDHTAPARGRLAQYLRRHREMAQVTYEELARCTNLSAATLKRAASGRNVPKLGTLEAYITGCGGDEHAVQAATELWRAARIEERGRLDDLRAPRPELIGDAGDLSNALELVWERAGAPALREIRERSGSPLALPVSSAARIVNRETVPADLSQLTAFLTGCGVPTKEHGPWKKAWNKITSRRAASHAKAASVAPSAIARAHSLTQAARRRLQAMGRPVPAADKWRHVLPTLVVVPFQEPSAVSDAERWAYFMERTPPQALQSGLEAGKRSALVAEAERNGVSLRPIDAYSGVWQPDLVVRDGDTVQLVEVKRYADGSGPFTQDRVGEPVRPSGSGLSGGGKVDLQPVC